LRQDLENKENEEETVSNNQASTRGVVLDAWKTALDSESIDTSHGFFEAGGSSIAAAEMMAVLSLHFGVRLRLRLLMEEPTVDRLTRAIERTLSSS
jgi:acyl carrier protein